MLKSMNALYSINRKIVLNNFIKCRSFVNFSSCVSINSVYIPNVYSNTKCSCSQINVVSQNFPSFSIIKRYKQSGKKQRAQDDSDSDDEKDDNSKYEDVSYGRDTKVIITNVTSMRADIILKAGLKLARNKIEALFYESKLRLNGSPLMKKSAHINIGDELDVIKGFSTQNPEFLQVYRIEILDVAVDDNELELKARCTKNLLIENYEIPWSPDAKDQFLQNKGK